MFKFALGMFKLCCSRRAAFLPVWISIVLLFRQFQSLYKIKKTRIAIQRFPHGHDRNPGDPGMSRFIGYPLPGFIQLSQAPQMTAIPMAFQLVILEFFRSDRIFSASSCRLVIAHV